MAGRGPAPKGQRARDRDTPDMETVVDTGALHGPELPADVLPDGEDWHPQTRALWDSLRRSPLLAGEHAMGWQFLIDTALMHHVMWMKGRWEFASEVRLRVAKFGATPEDRMRLKVKIETPSSPTTSSGPSATVVGIRDRKSRLTG